MWLWPVLWPVHSRCSCYLVLSVEYAKETSAFRLQLSRCVYSTDTREGNGMFEGLKVFFSTFVFQ